MMMQGLPMIQAEGLEKRFGATHALRGLTLSAPQGSVLGLLGPNGAGKTTAVRILTTLLRPDAGRALVAGFDVARQPGPLRAHIGLTGQATAVDEYLTGREHLELIGRLYHLPRAFARRRAGELLERFDLGAVAARPVKTYSGGLRRRLDLAASLIVAPPVLFLDEPTTGLDPRARLATWEIIAELVAAGTTVLLTTQYLDEADQLANHIVVVDAGRVIAEGSPDDLKARVGGERLELTVARGGDPHAAAAALAPFTAAPPHVDAERRRVIAPVAQGARLLAETVRALDAAGVYLDDLALRRPTLDDVFLALTGHTAADTAAPESAPASRRRAGRA